MDVAPHDWGPDVPRHPALQGVFQVKEFRRISRIFERFFFFFVYFLIGKYEVFFSPTPFTLFDSQTAALRDSFLVEVVPASVNEVSALPQLHLSSSPSLEEGARMWSKNTT